MNTRLNSKFCHFFRALSIGAFAPIFLLTGLLQTVEAYGGSPSNVVTTAHEPHFASIVQGVSQIVSRGTPGPIWGADASWVPIVSGDEDASLPPSVLVIARTYGAGRIVASGHNGFLTQMDWLDNRQLTRNLFSWLDSTNLKKVACTIGHGEWSTRGVLGNLVGDLTARGYMFREVVAPLSTVSLQGTSVLFVGNAWSDFTSAEIEAVRSFVFSGGGLFLDGLGWSWLGYHPGQTILDYPMMKMGAPYGARWLDNYLVDETNYLDVDGYPSPVFHVFYPNIVAGTLQDAFDYVSQVHMVHPNDLGDALESDSALRVNYGRAHEVFKVPTREFPASDPERLRVFEFYKSLILSSPGYFRKFPAFDQTLRPTLTWVRERVFRTWIDALPLNEARKAEIAGTAGLSGRYLDIWTTLGVWLLDNASLDGPQLEFIYNYLSLVPSELHNLRAISVADFLGNPRISIPLDGQNRGVNIFGTRIGGYAENSFPGDVPPGIVDGFAIVVAHEVNHSVDAVGISRNAALSQRRAALIAAAGRDPLNYLRSMIAEGFFADNPQEFFASIANQWFTDSAKTFQLGLERFYGGRHDPINQAVFFADVYSLGGNSTWFYTIDAKGNIQPHTGTYSA